MPIFEAKFREADSSVWLATAPALALGDFDAGLTVLFDGSGLGLGQGSGVSCFPFNPACAPNDTVDVLLGVGVQGGNGLPAGLIADGAVATSVLGLTKTAAPIPEPSTLALLAAGFAGIGVAQHRRRKAGRHKPPLSS